MKNAFSLYLTLINKKLDFFVFVILLAAFYLFKCCYVQENLFLIISPLEAMALLLPFYLLRESQFIKLEKRLFVIIRMSLSVYFRTQLLHAFLSSIMFAILIGCYAWVESVVYQTGFALQEQLAQIVIRWLFFLLMSLILRLCVAVAVPVGYACAGMILLAFADYMVGFSAGGFRGFFIYPVFGYPFEWVQLLYVGIQLMIFTTALYGKCCHDKKEMW